MTKELLVQGTPSLGVSVGEATRGTALTRILALKSSPGWLVEGNAIKEWRFSGVSEQEGFVYLYGPLATGRTLEEVLALRLREALPWLARLAGALVLLAERSVPWFTLQTDAILFTATGVLFLPPALFQELRDLRPFEQNKETWECLAHPDLKGEGAVSFGIAAALYRVITGAYPFSGKDAEELHEQARKLAITAPARLVPELIPEVSTLVMAGLGRERRPSVKLEEWARELDAWLHRDLFRTLGPEEKQKAEADAQVRQETSARAFRRRVFWQKNWKLVAIVAGAVIVVGVIGGSILRNVLAPRVTRGFLPQKVVETFYKSMNALDQSTMEACVVNKAGQGEINEVTTLYVTSRVVMGYEGRSNIESAADWDAQGRPDIVSPSSLYGVTNLSVTQEQGEPSPVYLVKYQKWNPASAPDTGSAPDLNALPQSEGHAVTDHVFLRKDKGDWVIYKIDRLQWDPLPAPKTVPAPPQSQAQQLQPGGVQ